MFSGGELASFYAAKAMWNLIIRIVILGIVVFSVLLALWYTMPQEEYHYEVQTYDHNGHVVETVTGAKISVRKVPGLWSKETSSD